jgi:hypothetical protein
MAGAKKPRKQREKSDKPRRVSGAMEAAFRAYLRFMLGSRTQKTLAVGLGVTRGHAGHLLSGRNEITPTHLQSLCDHWGESPSQMLKNIARVALNLEMGDPPGTGIVQPESVLRAISADAARVGE